MKVAHVYAVDGVVYSSRFTDLFAARMSGFLFAWSGSSQLLPTFVCHAQLSSKGCLSVPLVLAVRKRVNKPKVKCAILNEECR